MVKLFRYSLAVLILIGLSEISPRLVNGILVLVIVGVILGNFTQFQWMVNFIAAIGGEE